MKVIWSLFDSETAITQKLNNDEYKVYSIGLPSSSAKTDNFIKIDLSKKSCIKKLEKLPSPDIIFASPPCESWVTVSVGLLRFYNRNRNFNEHNLHWQKNFKRNDFTPKHRRVRLLGQKTAYWTAKIIQHFKPDMWCIENGSSSLIFKYLYTFHGLSGYQNKTQYSSYDSQNFGLKPTTIYSNKKMILKKLNIINDITIVSTMRSYSDRSRVPLGLYQHILKIYENKEQLQLF